MRLTAKYRHLSVADHQHCVTFICVVGKPKVASVHYVYMEGLLVDKLAKPTANISFRGFFVLFVFRTVESGNWLKCY